VKEHTIEISLFVSMTPITTQKRDLALMKPAAFYILGKTTHQKTAAIIAGGKISLAHCSSHSCHGDKLRNVRPGSE
jgi:hypothetical protein